jgi:hypothetical protein
MNWFRIFKAPRRAFLITELGEEEYQKSRRLTACLKTKMKSSTARRTG